MRISIFFPLVYMAARSIPIGWIAVMGFVASNIACALHSSPYSADYAMTFHYAAIFCLGSLLAQRRDVLCLRLQALKKSTLTWMLVLCLGLFTYGQGPLSVIRRFEPLTDWGVVAGCSGLVMLAIADDRVGSFLRSAIPQFLGRISYSLYLVHATVLFALVHLLYGRWPLALILALFLPLSITLAWLFHLAIEVPAIHAGRMAQARLRPRSTGPNATRVYAGELAIADAQVLSVEKAQKDASL
jgi:peptidoglycan/LPS O-acetylase OafA/YrhL